MRNYLIAFGLCALFSLSVSAQLSVEKKGNVVFGKKMANTILNPGAGLSSTLSASADPN